jgi:hypothetical protein
MVGSLQDLDLKMTALARPSGKCADKLQTHPVVREGAPQEVPLQLSENIYHGSERKIGRGSQMVA